MQGTHLDVVWVDGWSSVHEFLEVIVQVFKDEVELPVTVQHLHQPGGKERGREGGREEEEEADGKMEREGERGEGGREGERDGLRVRGDCHTHI